MRRGKRIVRIVFKSLGVVTTALVICGVIYEEIGRRQERDRLPQIGGSVDIGGRTLNLYCSGEGFPPVSIAAIGCDILNVPDFGYRLQLGGSLTARPYDSDGRCAGFGQVPHSHAGCGARPQLAQSVGLGVAKKLARIGVV